MSTDISKCANEGCPRKKKCKRYMMQAGMMQSYTIFPGGYNCQYFIANGKYNNETL